MTSTGIDHQEPSVHDAEIVLQGGPPGLEPSAALPRTSPLDHDRLKIPYGAGFEHYLELDATVPKGGPRVFCWVRRTAIAE